MSYVLDMRILKFSWSHIDKLCNKYKLLDVHLPNTPTWWFKLLDKSVGFFRRYLVIHLNCLHFYTPPLNDYSFQHTNVQELWEQNFYMLSTQMPDLNFLDLLQVVSVFFVVWFNEVCPTYVASTLINHAQQD